MPTRNSFASLLNLSRFSDREASSRKATFASRVMIFSAVLFLAEFGTWLHWPHELTSSAWLAKGLLLGMLVAMPRRHWKETLLFGGSALAMHGVFKSLQPSILLITFPGIMILQVYLGASVWRWTEQQLLSAESPIRFVAALSAVCATAPLIGTTLSTTAALVSTNQLSLAWLFGGGSFAGAVPATTMWLEGWFTDVVGTLIIAPAWLCWRGRKRYSPTIAYNGGGVEGALLLCSLLAVLSYPYLVGHEALTQNAKFLVLPLLLIVAFRFGPRGISIALLPVALFSVSDVAHALTADPASTKRFEALFDTQVYLFTVCICFQFVAVLASEKESMLKRFTQLTILSPVGIYLRGPEGDITYRNPKLDEILGPDNPLRFLEAVPHSVPAKELQCLSSPLAAQVREIHISPHEGHACDTWLQAHTALVVADSGHVLGEVGAIVDVSLQKKIQFELERAARMEKSLRQEAEKMMRMREEFLAVVSHELATPMTAILGWAQMLASGDLTPQRQRQGIGVILKAAREEGRLIGELIDFSRVLASKLELTLKTFELQRVAQSVLSDSLSALKAKAMEAQLIVPPQPIYVHGDVERVTQVVSAIVSNAIKFSEFGGRITITLLHCLKETTLCVRDEGKGIAPEFLPHVFDVFSQEDASLTRTQGGLGLGLAIARRIVQLHEGTLEAHSEGLGKGAEFTVKLPTENYMPSREFDEVLLDPALRPSEKLTGLRIMVVDDDPDCLDILGSWLSSQGADIQSFSEARDAYLQVVELQPHIVLSDLSMPHVDGITFIEKLVSTRHYGDHSIVIAAVTAFGDEHKRREALSKGFNGYFVKPYRFCELLDWLVKVKHDLEQAGQLAPAAPQLPTRESSTDTMHL